ncbi:uncharacterized protein SCHCODRAFT_02607244 [Schizophyllum commune H4-8]|uniref:uncharacterized protein n=1 Tax=Schizophyllum commune (strain H4-8 / FGSC 9210) TaxID=578458 RepID=UPI00216037EE|nr:uncharacterized protein SCHCODRAFT_02607244 [Schizophyllum commune H4-8]KAI5900184.1 hypothetical protein SCHCODRAFT_02607244 [Schizophyllum commune H4-8]
MSYTLAGGRLDASEAGLGGNGLEALQCQLCFINLDKFTIKQREEHYDNHFKDEGPSGAAAQIPKNNFKRNRTTSSSSWKGKGKGALDSMNWKTRDSGFWHPGLPTPPPSCFTPGVIPLLKRALRRSFDRGKTQHAVICHHRAIHISNEMFDRTWGCGYRNFLMACAILMVQNKQPAYADLLQRPLVPPSVRNLQRWIEEAWAVGFDREGAQQLKKLVGTGKWIGTADLWVAFACRGIPAELVDFDLKNQPNADPVIQWIMQYFDPPNSPRPAATDVNTALMNSSPIVSTDRMPIILQYNGHSQTIVGYEQMRDGRVNLLTLDPGRTPTKHLRQAALADAGFAQSAAVSPLSSRDQGGQREAETSQGPPGGQQGPPRNQHGPSHSPEADPTGSQDRHPHAHKIKDFIQHGSLRKHGKRRAPESPPNQRATQRHAGHVNGDKAPTGNAATPKGPTSTRANALAPRGGASAPKPDLDWGQTMRFFRKDGKQLNKKDSYQILYFPLTPPLTEAEKMQRRVVYSTRIC